MPNLEFKIFNFKLSEIEEKVIDNAKYGIIKGYASTFGNVDRNNDEIAPDAFDDCIKQYVEDNRQIRMHYQHGFHGVIGGFPPDKIKIDEKGLYVEGNINLDVQQGREAYALAKQGVMSDMSIGYTVDDFSMGMSQRTRLLKKITLWEISLVSEPMNSKAKIEEIKALTQFQDLALADDDVTWDKTTAISRVKKFTNSEEAPSDSYKEAFMWYDEGNKDNFAAYKLPYVDVIDGKLKAVPRAIYAIAVVLKGGRGGLNIPDDDKKKVIAHVNKYYSKMDKDSPLKGFVDNATITIDDIGWIKNNSDVNLIFEEIKFIVDDFKCRKEFDVNLRKAGFSREAANFLISRNKIKQGQPDVDNVDAQTIAEIKNLIVVLRKLDSLI